MLCLYLEVNRLVLYIGYFTPTLLRSEYDQKSLPTKDFWTHIPKERKRRKEGAKRKNKRRVEEEDEDEDGEEEEDDDYDDEE